MHNESYWNPCLSGLNFLVRGLLCEKFFNNIVNTNLFLEKYKINFLSKIKKLLQYLYYNSNRTAKKYHDLDHILSSTLYFCY